MLSECKLFNCETGTLGLHLSRAPWDPYPWVSNIQPGSTAENAGIRVGDTVMQLNGLDVLGKKISEIAEKLREHWDSGAAYVTIAIWRSKTNQTAVASQGNEQAEIDADNGRQ